MGWILPITLLLCSLALDAMLKSTGIEPERLSGGDMYLSLEKGIRGGVSKIGSRYSKSSKYMGDLHDPKQSSSCVNFYL